MPGGGSRQPHDSAVEHVIQTGSQGHELLDEGEHHASTALNLFEQLRSPDTHQTLNLLVAISEARGDTAADAAADAASADAQELAGAQSLPPDLVLQLAGLD